jgi:multiple sugar transport system permease protein
VEKPQLATRSRAKSVRAMRIVALSVMRAAFIIGISFIILRPLLIKVISSFMSASDILDPTTKWIPRSLGLENYRVALDLMKYPQRFLNSFLLSACTSVAQLVSCTVVGYGFARYKFRGREFFFALVVFTLIVPPQLLMIPMYLNFRFFNPLHVFGRSGVNLLNSYWPFVLTSLTGTGFRNGLFIYVMRQFFAGMSNELEEAANVDGAGALRTFLTIMLPNAVPAMVIVFVFSFVWQWNDLFYTQLYVSEGDLLPFSLLELHNLIRFYTLEQWNLVAPTEYVSIVSNTAMLAFISPLLLFYACLQRFFIESIERTGLVG